MPNRTRRIFPAPLYRFVDRVQTVFDFEIFINFAASSGSFRFSARYKSGATAIKPSAGIAIRRCL
jgi:hypothetical protein